MAKVQRRQLPDVGMLFLNLTVRREHLVSDSLNEVSFFLRDYFWVCRQCGSQSQYPQVLSFLGLPTCD